LPTTPSLLLVAILTVQALPGIGATVAEREIRVTLLSASNLDEAEYRRETARAEADWGGGGFHIIFNVENRPGAPFPPVLGDVRVLLGGVQYNAVSKATSRKPFTPLIVVREVKDVVDRDSRIRSHLPAPRPDAVNAILDVYIPGTPVGAGAKGEVILEQCETHRVATDGRLEAVTETDWRNRCVDFRFAFSIVKREAIER
jgi:hypothetical protein